MNEISPIILLSASLYIFIPFVCGYIAKKLNISPLVGYIIGGLILGNLFGKILNDEVLVNFAYFGILLLLFTVGLELNFARIVELKKYIFFGGFLQIVFSIIFIFFISVFFKFSLLVSVLIGIAFASSSTTLIVKIIQDRGEENSYVGELVLGILMFQDLAFIPFMIIFSSITSAQASLTTVFVDVIVGFIKAGIIIVGMYYFGKRIIPQIFDKVARVSRELLNLFLVLFIFVITFFSTLVGIPILVGVFIAGIIVAQASEHHHIFTQIRPFRDVLAVVFFIFIGLQLHIPEVLRMIHVIAAFTLFIFLIKSIIIFAIFLFFRFHTRTAFMISLYLFQIDEDAFILMSSTYSQNVISRSDYLFITASVLMTLILTPLIISRRDTLYNSIRTFIKKRFVFLDSFINNKLDTNISPIDELSLQKHVIICGYGRVGSYIGRALTLAHIPFIAIDYNFATVEKYKKKGIYIIYGDPSDIDILDYAETEHAELLISAVPERFTQEAIAINARKLNPSIRIITRIHHKQDTQRIKDLGVDTIIQPEFEASISIVRKILLFYGVEKDNIVRKIQRLKIEHGML